MRAISVWAKHNPQKARTFIVFSKFVLAGMSWYVGQELNNLGIKLPASLCYIAVLLYLMAAFFYPSVRLSSLSKSLLYARQKTCDVVLGLSTFVLFVTLVNTDLLLSNNSGVYAVVPTSGNADNPKTASEILASLQTKQKDKSDLTRKEKRVLRKEFRHQVKTYIHAKLTGDKEGAEKAVAIILVIIAAIGLLGLVAAWSCSLSCDGSGGAAALVAILGTAAIVFLAVLAIKKINNHKKKGKE